MRDLTVRIKQIKKISAGIFLVGFDSEYISTSALPGQFVHMNINSQKVILRRPFSIHQISGRAVYILFKVRGKGTEILSFKKPGDKIKVLGPLGRGFSLPEGRQKSVLIAGGIGIAPMVFLSRRIKKANKEYVLLGAKTKQGILFKDYFKKQGFKVLVATEDGSVGYKGKVIDLLKSILAKEKSELKLYACGPKPMYKSLRRIIRNRSNLRCQVSLEEFMGCGIGACKGCAVELKTGIKYVCKDGPVFNIEDLVL